MASTSLVEVHARQLGEERRTWGGLGWRSIYRIVNNIESDPDYEDVETGTIKAGGKIWQVWRRSGRASWTTNKEAATRYATLRAKEGENVKAEQARKERRMQALAEMAHIAEDEELYD